MRPREPCSSSSRALELHLQSGVLERDPGCGAHGAEQLGLVVERGVVQQRRDALAVALDQRRRPHAPCSGSSTGGRRGPPSSRTPAASRPAQGRVAKRAGQRVAQLGRGGSARSSTKRSPTAERASRASSSPTRNAIGASPITTNVAPGWSRRPASSAAGDQEQRRSSPARARRNRRATRASAAAGDRPVLRTASRASPVSAIPLSPPSAGHPERCRPRPASTSASRFSAPNSPSAISTRLQADRRAYAAATTAARARRPAARREGEEHVEEEHQRD